MGKKNSLRRDVSHRRGGRDTQHHWLGLGQLGQDTLFQDFDPWLYAVDARIFRFCTRIIHNRSSELEEPLALLTLPGDSLTWHIGKLSEWFHVGVWCDEPDPLLEDAAERFSVSAVHGELQDLREGISLLAYLNTRWESQNSFLRSLFEAGDALAPDGAVVVVLCAESIGEKLVLHWDDGSYSPLDEMIEDARHFFPGMEVRTDALTPELLADEEMLTEFLKRHRDYFGKNARDLCLSRMRERDIVEACSTGTHWSVLLRWAAGQM